MEKEQRPAFHLTASERESGRHGLAGIDRIEHQGFRARRMQDRLFRGVVQLTVAGRQERVRHIDIGVGHGVVHTKKAGDLGAARSDPRGLPVRWPPHANAFDRGRASKRPQTEEKSAMRGAAPGRHDKSIDFDASLGELLKRLPGRPHITERAWPGARWIT